MRKTYENVRKSFLGIDVTLRKKTRLEKAESEDDPVDAEGQRLQQLMENEQPLEAWGVAVEKDLILMADKGLKEADIDKVRVTDSAGAAFEAKLFAVGKSHDFVLLKPTSPRELTPLAFVDWARPALGENFHVTFAERVDNRWHLNVSPYIQTNAPLIDAPGWFCIDAMRPGSVVSDKKGEPVGVALDQYLWVAADGRSSFLGKAVLADERLADLEKRYEPLRKSLPASVKRVEVTFRSEKNAERYMPPDETRGGKATLFGVTIDDKGTLFVAEDLGRDAVRKIEDIVVVEEGGARHDAVFVGMFKAFGGFLVRAAALKAQPGIAADGAAPPAGEAFFTAAFEDRFGASRIKLDYNRLFRVEQGLAGAPRSQPRKRVKPGTFLLDFAGRIVGVATADKKEEDLDDVAMEASRERYYMERYRGGLGADHLRRLLYFSEIAGVLASPAAHFDARAVPMSKKEEKKLVWLGVEYQEVSKPIADALAIQARDLTNDGRRGLVVTEIYPGSPAEKAGIRPDDVLLTLRPEGEASTRDLVGEPDRFGGMGRGNPYGGGRGGPMMAPWRPTRNYLTSMLTEIGATKKVTLEVLRAKAKRPVALTLEYAPVDYETAERYKDDAFGFTVKDLTYEVRLFHKLDGAATGVVVARVESGGKSDIGKLQPLSIVTRVNNVGVKGLGHFQELVTSAKSVTLTTIAYGQTKLVELTRE